MHTPGVAHQGILQQMVPQIPAQLHPITDSFRYPGAQRETLEARVPFGSPVWMGEPRKRHPPHHWRLPERFDALPREGAIVITAVYDHPTLRRARRQSM